MGAIDRIRKAIGPLFIPLFAKAGSDAATSTEELLPGILDALTKGLYVHIVGSSSGATANANDATQMVPMTGNGTAHPAPPQQLNSANTNESKTGWFFKNENTTKTIRLGDASLTNSTGFAVGPGEIFYIASSKLLGHYVVSPDGPATFCVWGES